MPDAQHASAPPNSNRINDQEDQERFISNQVVLITGALQGHVAFYPDRIDEIAEQLAT